MAARTAWDSANPRTHRDGSATLRSSWRSPSISTARSSSPTSRSRRDGAGDARERGSHVGSEVDVGRADPQELAVDEPREQVQPGVDARAAREGLEPQHVRRRPWRRGQPAAGSARASPAARGTSTSRRRRRPAARPRTGPGGRHCPGTGAGWRQARRTSPGGASPHRHRQAATPSGTDTRSRRRGPPPGPSKGIVGTR